MGQAIPQAWKPQQSLAMQHSSREHLPGTPRTWAPYLARRNRPTKLMELITRCTHFSLGFLQIEKPKEQMALLSPQCPLPLPVGITRAHRMHKPGKRLLSLLLHFREKLAPKARNLAEVLTSERSRRQRELETQIFSTLCPYDEQCRVAAREGRQPSHQALSGT